MADIKISELTTASEIKNEDNIELSQNTGNGLVSLKATILALATKIVTAINFTSALDTTNKTITGAINEVAQGGGGGGTDVIAEDFDSTATYAVGDYCIYEGSLYKCTTAVTTAGDWDSTDWTETLVMDEVEQGGGGGSAEGIHLTQAEYDALPASKLTDGKIYFIDDGISGRDIVANGVFVDVDNVIKAQTTLTNSVETTYTTTEDCCILFYFNANSANAGYMKINDVFVIAVTSTFRNFAFVKKGSVVKMRSCVDDSGFYTVYGIQQGTNSAYAQSMHHYSTDEHIVGTWIDGKTIYEKSYSDTTPSSTTSKNYSLGVSNIDEIIYYDGMVYRNDGAICKLDHARGDDLMWTMVTASKEFVINIKDSQYVSQTIYFTVRYTKSS